MQIAPTSPPPLRWDQRRDVFGLISHAGGIQALLTKLGVARTTIVNWKQTGTIPANRVSQISDAFNLPRDEVVKLARKARGGHGQAGMPESNADRLRRIRRDNPKWSRAKNALWEAAHPEKLTAHRVVARELKAGRMVRRPCERCGNAKQVHAHHDDYSQPMVVVWLCPAHHRDRHRELREMAATP